MQNDVMISVRISKSLKKIKEDLDIGWAEIIKSGIENEVLRTEKNNILLSELAQEYNELYIQCITKLQKNKDLYIQRSTGFEGITNSIKNRVEAYSTQQRRIKTGLNQECKKSLLHQLKVLLYIVKKRRIN